MAIREKIILDTRPFDKSVSKVKKDTRRLGRDIDSETRGTSKRVEGNFNRMGSGIKAGMLLSFASITVGATKLFQYLRSGLERGREIEEIASKYESVLGGSIQRANVFIEENARLIGLSTVKAKEYYANIVNIAQGMGFAKDQAIPFSEEILKLAGDLQSFNDVPIEQTQRAIVSALTGEREALKTLGIVVNEEMVKQQAMTQFRLKDADSITQQHKALATLELITKKAGKAIGDLERTQNSSSNRYRQNLARLNDMLDSLSTKLNQGFGNDLIVWMTKGLDLAEDLVDELNKLTSSSTENLIRDLRANNADPELIAKLEEAQAIADAQKLKMSIEKELKDIKVPVNIDEAGLLDNAKGVLSAINKQFGIGLFTGGGSVFKIGDQIKNLRQGLADFKIEDEGFNADKLDVYKERLDGMVSSLKNLSEAAIFARENGFDAEADLFTSEANAYGDAISQLAEIIGKMERVNQLNDQLSNKGGVQLKQAVEATGESVNQLISYIKLEPLKFDVDVEPKIDPDKFKTVLSNSFSDIARNYTEEITKLNNLLAVGMIDEETFLQGSKETSIAFKQALIDLYKEAKRLGKLTPELEKAFEDALGKIEGDTKKVTANFDDIADSLSGILSVADAFGKIDDNLKNVLRGSIDVFKNLQNIKDLDGEGLFGLGGTKLAGVLPVLGIAGGIGSIISGLFNDNDDSEQREELERTIHEQIIAIEKNTQALLRQAVVGGDTRAEDVDRVLDIIKSLGGSDLIFGGGGVGTIFNPNVSKDEAAKLFEELEALFPDLFRGIKDDFLRTVERDGLRDALEQYQALLGNLFADFASNFGEYGNSIDGAIQAFRDAISFGAIDTQTALTSFIAAVKQLGTEIPSEILNEISKIDLSTEEGQKQLDELIKSLFEGQFLGDLSPDEYRNLLDFLQGLSDGTVNVEGSTRNVAVGSAITEFQSNDLIAIQEDALRQLRALVDIARTSSALAPIVAPRPPQSSVNNVSIGGINVKSNMSDNDISQVTEQVARELKKSQQRGF